MSQHSRDNPGGGEYEGHYVSDDFSLPWAFADDGMRNVTPRQGTPGNAIADDDGTGNVPA